MVEVADVRCAVAVLTLAACNQVYGLDPTTVRTLEPPACSTVQFSIPRVLPEFAGGDREFDPQLSGDGKELWLVMATPISGGEDRDLMYRSVLQGDRFSTPVLTNLADMNTQANGDPALTADGLRLIFRVDQAPTLFEGIRSSPDQFPFDNIVQVRGLPQYIRSFDVTWDGLRIYYADEEGVLRVAARAARNLSFVPDPTFMLANVAFPTVSGDELEIFYVHPNDSANGAVYRRERASTSDPFGPEDVAIENASDPDIAPTSSEMIVGYDGALAIMKRTCEMD